MVRLSFGGFKFVFKYTGFSSFGNKTETAATVFQYIIFGLIPDLLNANIVEFGKLY